MTALKDDVPSVRNIWVLIGTLALAVVMSFIFIKLIVLLDLKDYLGLVVPLLPVFYTIIYPILDRPFSREIHQKVHRGEILPIEVVTPSYFRSLSAWRIAGAIIISLGIKFLMEFTHYGMLIFLSDGSLANFWMHLDPALLFDLARGDLAVSPIPFLFLEMIMMSLAGGIWLGYSSKSRPVMEGIVSGTLISIVIAFSNLTPLYGTIKNVTTRLTGMSGEGLHLEIFSGVIFFTFIFSCWVLLGIKMKPADGNLKKSSKKSNR